MQVVASPHTTHDPKSSYSRISEAFRHVTAGPLQCQVFCGGKSCKYERSDVWNSEQMAIPGLFSHWVTDNILAMARPNYTEMKKYNMIYSFKKEGISTVINLQEAGEHASCGSALHSSGFSYDPIEFMNNDIFYYNFNIQDYSVPLQRTLLDICKVVTFAQTEGSVAVHCHAGLGRTGVVIACFLVYHHKMKPKDAILLVRKNRPRSIQTRNQLKAVFRFANFLAPLWIQFPAFAPQCPSYTLEELIANQKIVLHGTEGKTLKYTPKLVYMVCSLMMEKIEQPPGILYKKIRANSVVTRPFTCPSYYQFEDDDDLDSLAGGADLGACSEEEGELEMEELEQLMTPRNSSLRRARSEECLSEIFTSPCSQDRRITNISHRLNLSPRPSIARIHLTPQEPVLPESSEETVDTRDTTSSETLPVPEVNSTLQLYSVTEEVQSAVSQFVSGISGHQAVTSPSSQVPGDSLKFDTDLIISQINVGIWESLNSQSPFQLGCLLRTWFTSLTKPVLSMFEVEALFRKSNVRVRDEDESTPKYLDKLAHAFDTLSPPLVATVHCLATTFAVLLHGPFNLKRSSVFTILHLLLTHKDNQKGEHEGEIKRLSPILAALILSKHNEILRHSPA